MLRKNKNIVGQKFGFGTVLEFTNQTRHDSNIWLLQCECGNKYEATLHVLRHGYGESCGCKTFDRKSKAKWQGYGEISLDFFHNIKRGAKARKHLFKISIEYIWDLYEKQNRKCALSGIDLKFSRNKKKDKTGTASLDRIDSSKGYIEGNVQWVHKTVNMMKNKLNQQEFINICKMIAQKSS